MKIKSKFSSNDAIIRTCKRFNKRSHTMKEYMNVINNAEAFYKACASEGKNVFVFSANWCPDCRFLEGFFEDVVKEYTAKGFTFYYVDRDQCMDLCVDLMIMGIPSFVIYLNGKESNRFVSKQRKTREEIEQFLNQVNQ